MFRLASLSAASFDGCGDGGGQRAIQPAREVRCRCARSLSVNVRRDLTIEELLTLRARTETAGNVGDEHEWSGSRRRG